ncbi:hypothetical protein BT96DRAFT_637133 [Gymnopus androsaceus JB14]|uniref:Uncharacterized protein n=1 Tax=Gymnopus androsaceus JB14 TaxID=1447944 RepID=A0A6A4GH86_9AGAR|nr:hypothetical protein BT96DRAFT_637133 [Gymnopus androsaceus JB14]
MKTRITTDGNPIKILTLNAYNQYLSGGLGCFVRGLIFLRFNDKGRSLPRSLA